MPGKALIPYRKPARRAPQRKTVKLERTRTVPPPAVVKIARVVDEATGFAYDRFAAKSDLGQPVQVDVQSDKSEKPGEVLAELRKRNAALTAKASMDAVKAAIDAEPLHHLRHAAQPGWYPSQPDAFVRPTHTVGAILGVEKVLPPRSADVKRQIVFSNGGTVEDWRKGVAQYASRSTRITLMMGAAFAGPLVRLLGLQSFGVLLFGPPKSGKSTAQVVAGSIVGLRNEEALPNFKATNAALDQIAIQCNDALLPINEAALLGKEGFTKLGPLLYGLSEGKDRTRHDAWNHAVDVGAAGWRLVYVLSSEQSAEELAADKGMTRAGDVYRCLDVPAVHGGHETIFDRRPKGISEEVFTRCAHKWMDKIRKACELHHGVAFDTYLRGLIKLGDKLKPRAQAYVDEFVGSLNLKGADGAIKHAARNFGVIYAGLRLAMEVGPLVGIGRPGAVRAAIKSCFRDGLKVTRARDTRLAEAKVILHQRLQDTALPRKEDLQPNRDVGFRTVEGGIEVVSIRSTEFVRWFEGKPAHLHALLAWLDEQGALRKSHEGKRPAGRGYEWAVTSPRAQGFKGRCIVLRLPIPK